MMLLVLDTEFTGLSDPANDRKLLSLAMVAEGGSAEWYAELDDWVLTDCDLRSRVVGVMPVFQIGDADTSAVPGTRYHEIQNYLDDTGNRKRPWLALDDDPDFFPPRCAELVMQWQPRFWRGRRTSVAVDVAGQVSQSRDRGVDRRMQEGIKQITTNEGLRKAIAKRSF